MMRVIFAPAGNCPIRLNSPDIDDVEDWVFRLKAWGLSNNVRYERQAFVYYLRQFFDMQSPQYATAKVNVLECLM